MSPGFLGAVFEGARRGGVEVSCFVEAAFGALGDEDGGSGGGALEDQWERELVVGGGHCGKIRRRCRG